MTPVMNSVFRATNTVILTCLMWCFFAGVAFILFAGISKGLHDYHQEEQQKYLKPGWHENPDGSASKD